MKEARAKDWDLKKLRKLKSELEADDSEQTGEKTFEEEMQVAVIPPLIMLTGMVRYRRRNLSPHSG